MLVVGQQNWVLRTDVLSHVLSHFSLCGLKEKNKYSCIKVQSDKTAIDNLVYTAKVETQTWRANGRILRGKREDGTLMLLPWWHAPYTMSEHRLSLSDSFLP